MRSFCAAGLVCSVMIASPLATFGQETHGTINVALANSNGMVAETDSMLSNNKGLPLLQSGRKLYQADDHTVYMIADFFGDSGPPFGAGNYPAYTVMRSSMLRYIRNRNPSLTISQQLDDLSDFVGMEIGHVAEIDAAMGIPTNPHSSLITIVGYENGKPTIGHIEVEPIRRDSAPFKKNKIIDVVADRLVYRVYGVTDVAQNILDHPEKLGADQSILGKYRASIEKDGGATFSTKELKQLADRLEELTAAKYPNIVGRQQEVAVMENGKISSFQPLGANEYELTGQEYEHAFIQVFQNGNFMGDCVGRIPQFIMSFTNRFLILLDNVQFKCQRRSLDGFVVTNSSFDSCTLRYDGNPVSYFGSNNTVTNSVLLLGPGVSDDSPFVLNFRAQYPNVPIRKAE